MLVDYYRLKRLHVQMHYLALKSKSDERSGSWTALLVQTLFFASFAFVVAHVAVHVNAILAARGGAKTEESPFLEQWLIGAAVGLPVFAAVGLTAPRGSSNETPCGIERHSIPSKS
jgi:hypothetical protein